MRLRLLVVFVAALVLSASPSVADDKKDQDALQGTWEVTAMVTDGKAEGADKIKGATIVIKGDKITLSAAEGKLKRSFTFKLDSSKKPKAIDAVLQDSPLEGKTAKGIYEIKGETLTWCMPQDVDGKRPTELRPKEGDKALIFTAKRVKP